MVRTHQTAATQVFEAQKLRDLAAWYRQFAERAGNPAIWEARLRTAEDLEKTAADLEKTAADLEKTAADLEKTAASLAERRRDISAETRGTAR